jgi:hypothetical protein
VPPAESSSLEYERLSFTSVAKTVSLPPSGLTITRTSPAPSISEKNSSKRRSSACSWKKISRGTGSKFSCEEFSKKFSRRTSSGVFAKFAKIKIATPSARTPTKLQNNFLFSAISLRIASFMCVTPLFC